MFNFKTATCFGIARCKHFRQAVLIRNVTTDAVRHFESIPRVPGLPVLGNWHLYKLGIFNTDKYHEVVQRLHDVYGPLVIQRIGWRQPVLHVFEPNDAEVIFKNEDKMPYIFPVIEATHINRKSIDFMSPGFAHTNGEEWYRLVSGIRKLMMRPNSMQQYLHIILATTDEIIGEIENSVNDRDRSVKSLGTILGKWHFDSTSKILLQDKLFDESGIVPYKRLLDANRDSFHLNSVLKFSLPFHRYWITPISWRLRKQESYTSKIVKTNVDKVIDKVEKGLKDRTLKNDDYSFLISLLQNDLLNKKDVISVSLSFVTDGLYTMIPVLQNVFYALAKNPDVQNKTFAEIQTVSNGSKSVTKEMLNDLVYLKAVLKETLRMYPNGIERSRINKKPLVLSGYHIPAQTQLRITMLVHFRSAKHFADPNVFKPERWLRGEQCDNSNPFLMQASFGGGARSCIGRRYAELAMFTLIIRMLQEFQLKLPDANYPEPEFVCNTFLAPKGESAVQFHPRN